MKYKPTGQALKNWNKISVAGFGLTGIGLVCVVLIVGQLAPPILEGEAPGVSTLEMAIEATFALIFLAAGFALMVVGSDPFDDVSSEFRFDADEKP